MQDWQPPKQKVMFCNRIPSSICPSNSTVPESLLKQMALEAAVFVIAGILLSLLAMAGGALLDRSLRFPIDVWHALHLPVLSSVPDMVRLHPEKKAKLFRRKKRESSETKDIEIIEVDPVSVGAADALEPQSTVNPILTVQCQNRGERKRQRSPALRCLLKQGQLLCLVMRIYPILRVLMSLLWIKAGKTKRYKKIWQ